MHSLPMVQKVGWQLPLGRNQRGAMGPLWYVWGWKSFAYLSVHIWDTVLTTSALYVSKYTCGQKTLKTAWSFYLGLSEQHITSEWAGSPLCLSVKQTISKWLWAVLGAWGQWGGVHSQQTDQAPPSIYPVAKDQCWPGCSAATGIC